MPTVKLYYMPESPPCRAIEMVANIIGVTLDKVPVNLFTKDNQKPEYKQVHPLGKIPYLVDGEVKIAESRAITAYLVNKYMPEDNTLYPRDPEKRAKVDELLYMDMGVLFLAASKLLRPRLFGPFKKELDPEAEQGLRDALSYFESRIGDKKFITGENLTIADMHIAVSLSFINACGFDTSEFKVISNYIGNLKASIPKYREINDGPEESLRNFVKSRQANA